MFCSPFGDEDLETREHYFTVEGDNKEDGEEETDPSTAGMEHNVV